MNPKTITLCADDFGLNPGVSQGILKLARLERLSAVSCMVNMPDFMVQAPALLALKKQPKIGLHFNLTEGNLLSMPDTSCFSLNELLVKTHLASLKPSLVAQEFKQQLERFMQVIGRAPDFIDGHQHVHQFPRIRQVILELYEQYLRLHKTSIRSTYPALSAGKYQSKTTILALTGGKALHAQLRKEAIPHNAYFSGIYDFDPATNYGELFRSWLSLAADNTLIMCHPGEVSNEPDVIAPTRVIELNYFLSDDFLNDCNQYAITFS